MQYYDRVIIGAGLYGLYAALKSAEAGCSVLVVEHDSEPFSRATYANQARVHQGYHYPRSLYTATKTANYFRRFNEEFGACINGSFKQIYATSSSMSWSNADQFRDFCATADIPCKKVDPSQYFNEGKCDGAFLTQEYTYDALLLRDYLMEKIAETGRVSFRFCARPESITESGNKLTILLSEGTAWQTGFLLNSSYASVNQILGLMDLEEFKIKYELCEIALCEPSSQLSQYGFTVMDGPFFSIMPFGFTGLHSLTSVSFTPHETSHEKTPNFSCQASAPRYCSSSDLGNCNECSAKPVSAFSYMLSLAKKYLKEEFGFSHVRSLYSVKPILKAAEVDDARPTVVKIHSSNPMIVSVLSGKISTIYDMDEVLDNE